MTVGELKEALKDVPDDLTVFAEGEQADKVLIEECFDNRYVRIFKTWQGVDWNLKFPEVSE